MSGRPPHPNSHRGNNRGGPRHPGPRHQGPRHQGPRHPGPRHPGSRHPSQGQNWQDAPPQHSGWNQSYGPDGQYQGYGQGGPQGQYTQYGPPGQNQAPGIMGPGPPGSEYYHGAPPGPAYSRGNYPPPPPTHHQPPPTYRGNLPPTPLYNRQNPQVTTPAPQVRTYSNSPVMALNNMNRDVVYTFLNESSPFQVLVCFGGQEFKGVAATKKAAKEEAAKQAMSQYYDMHYVPGQDKKDTKARENKPESQEQKKESISKKENQGKKKENTSKKVSKEERKTSESAEESHQKTVENLLSALSQLAGAKSEIPELGGLIADTRKDESEPKEAHGHKKTRRGKRAKKGDNKGGDNDDDDNGDDTDLISGETEREGSARGGRESGRGKGRGGRGRGRGQGRGRRNQHRSGDQGQSEDDEDDSEEDDDSDTGSVHSAVYQRSMGSGLNIASPNKRDRQFSSTDNISNAGRGRGRRGHRGQGQGRGRGGHGNMNRNTAEIESCHDEVDDLGLDENEVFEFVVKECGGMVKLSNLVDKCQLFPSGSDEARVGQWIKTHRRRFHVFQDGQEVVYVAPFFKDATYCLDYTRKQCNRENCDHFHICQHYMRGTCRKGDTCPKSHSFTDDHNLEHKIKLGLDGFSEIDMCIILLNRYPQICPKRYCKGDKRCPYLHICQRFISKNCKFGEKCRKGHSFDTEHNSWILNRIYHMEKWDKSEGSTFRNIISFPRRLRRGSRHNSGSSKQDDMDSLAGNLSDMSLESDSDSDSDDEPVKPDLLPRTISRKDRFKSTEQLHDTEYLRAVEVNIEEGTTSEGQGKKSRKKKGRKTESRGSDMSEEEVFDAGVKNRNRKDSDKSEEGGARRKDKNRGEQGKSDKSKNEDKESKERAKIYLDDADKTSICYNNVAGTCHIVNSCRFHHKTYGLPYLWQVKLMDKWRTFSQEENEIIERGFCNQLQVVDSKVSIEATEYKLHVCLDTELTAVVYEVASFPVQQAEHVHVRRLSTPSYAEKRANRPQHGDKRKGPTKEEEGQTGTFCTQWRWYFMDDHNRWTLFDKDGMQFTLEKKFMCNQKRYLFTRQDYNFKYKISFKEMEQINLDTGKRRLLLRRPLFVSRDDVSEKNFPQCLSVTISPGTPSHWAPLDMSGAEFELVELERTKEFNRVQDSFYATLDRQVYEIDLIYRVQNRSLWNEYFMKKKMMNEKAESEQSGQTVDERDLFHGTDSLETCRKICTNSFDFRISGKNATVYGEGSYFALESDYSNRYTNKTSGSRLMFRAKVLVGKYTKGERSFKRPPEIPGGSHKLYDSCVDHTANPTIFIIFDTRQCYPEYLIQYHKKGEEMLDGDVYVPPQPRPASVSSFSNTASSSNNGSVSSRPVVPPRIGGASTNVSSPSAAFSDPYGQVPSVSQSGVRTQASYSQGPVGQSAMQTQAHSQGPVSQSPVRTQVYSQDNSQFHGSPLDNQNVYYSRSAAEGARHTPTQTYRTASGREVPTPSYRRKEEGCILQ